MEVEGISLTQDTIEYICHHIKSNIRELEGVLISLVARASLNKKRIDLDLAREVVGQFVSQEIVLARQLSMYLAKNYTSVSLKTIGSNFGGKDHSTVLYSIRAVQDLMDTDSLFKDTVNQLEKQVQLSLTPA
jgi:chromosomal replication initiator protein